MLIFEDNNDTAKIVGGVLGSISKSLKTNLLTEGFEQERERRKKKKKKRKIL